MMRCTTTRSRPARWWLLAIVLAGLIATPLDARATPDDTAPETTTPETTEPETTATDTTAPATTTPGSAAVAPVPIYRILPSEPKCPPFEPGGEPQDSLTTFDMVCLQLQTDEWVDPLEPLVLDGSTRLIVDPRFDWTTDNVPALPTSFTIHNEAGASTVVPLTLRLQLGLDVRFTQASDSAEQDAAALTDTTTPDDGSTDSGAEGNTTENTIDADGGSGPAADVVVGQSTVTKTIALTGGDSELPGLEIREQINPSELRATMDGRELVPEDGEVRISLTESPVSYALQLAEGANFGSTSVEQRTAVFLGDDELVFRTSALTLDAPAVEVEVQAPAEIESAVGAGQRASVSVRLINQRDEEVPGELFLTLSPSEGESVVNRFDDVGGGELDGSRVTWRLPGGLPAGESIVRTVQVDLGPVVAPSRIVWRGAMTRNPAAEDFVVDTSLTDVRPPPVGGDTTVEFTPDQLIRLIAFVMAFALVAVIFGAWTRRSGSSSDTDENELKMFRAYIEAILVLVILVSILVLALRGSLNGESAASLIGVIAGYALGRSLGAK